ncbi:hypothetical protein GQ600_486 [Phytophthora cactorum]|nr:hypothetical protein GQ600_486 [Phytophthora cactorum]
MAARTTLLDAKLWQGQHRGVQLRGRRVRGCSDSNSKFHDRFDGQLDGGASQRASPGGQQNWSDWCLIRSKNTSNRCKLLFSPSYPRHNAASDASMRVHWSSSRPLIRG